MVEKSLAISAPQGGSEEGPICYIDEHNVDTCQIPKCGDSSTRRDTASQILPELCREL